MLMVLKTALISLISTLLVNIVDKTNKSKLVYTLYEHDLSEHEFNFEEVDFSIIMTISISLLDMAMKDIKNTPADRMQFEVDSNGIYFKSIDKSNGLSADREFLFDDNDIIVDFLDSNQAYRGIFKCDDMNTILKLKKMPVTHVQLSLARDKLMKMEFEVSNGDVTFWINSEVEDISDNNIMDDGLVSDLDDVDYDPLV